MKPILRASMPPRKKKAPSAKVAENTQDDPSPSTAPAQDANIEALLGDLEAVVEELEGGELPLDAALERFERGVKLAREGGRLLDAVEDRVEALLADRDEAVPFEPEEEE